MITYYIQGRFIINLEFSKHLIACKPTETITNTSFYINQCLILNNPEFSSNFLNFQRNNSATEFIYNNRIKIN